MGKETEEPLTIRQWDKKDLEAVLALEEAAFSHPWQRSAFSEELGNPLAIYLVLEHQGVLAAYGGFWLVLDEAQVTNVAVHPDYQGQGMGRKLLTALMDKAAALGAVSFTLEVRRSNKSAIRLYEQAGLRVQGVRPGYYADTGEDALLMGCEWHVPEEEGEE